MPKLVVTPKALDDIEYWVSKDKKIAAKIRKLIAECLETPSSGTGKPEPLKHNLSGFWSRRIDKKNRLIYSFSGEELTIVSCRGHYSDR